MIVRDEFGRFVLESDHVRALGGFVAGIFTDYVEDALHGAATLADQLERAASVLRDACKAGAVIMETDPREARAVIRRARLDAARVLALDVGLATRMSRSAG